MSRPGSWMSTVAKVSCTKTWRRCRCVCEAAACHMWCSSTSSTPRTSICCLCVQGSVSPTARVGAAVNLPYSHDARITKISGPLGCGFLLMKIFFEKPRMGKSNDDTEKRFRFAVLFFATLRLGPQEPNQAKLGVRILNCEIQPQIRHREEVLSKIILLV